MLNLINDAWIPVKHKSGQVGVIRPWEIIDDADPVTDVSFLRPDFNATVTQFLIGLVQTCQCPSDENEWLEKITTPPTQNQLKSSMTAVASSFEIFGDHNLFMQDCAISEKPDSIEQLIISAPAANTVELHKDFFVKHNSDFGLCPSCASAALITLQMLAATGGQGHRTSIRGSAATTVMLTGQTLWETVALNLLDRHSLLRLCPEGNLSKQVFPWLEPEGVADKPPVVPQGANPLLAYWAMPRRIRLGKTEKGQCSICGTVGPVVREYMKKPRGYNYDTSWTHPLSPTIVKKDSRVNMRITDQCFHYDNWSAILVKGRADIEPPPVMQYYRNRIRLLNRITHQTHSTYAWISGYDYDQAIARSWIDFRRPTIVSEQRNDSEIDTFVGVLISMAEESRKILWSSVFSVLNKEKHNSNPKKHEERLDDDFWINTEGHFCTDVVAYCNDEKHVAEKWKKSLIDACLKSFDEATAALGSDYYEYEIKERGKMKAKLYSKIKKVMTVE